MCTAFIIIVHASTLLSADYHIYARKKSSERIHLSLNGWRWIRTFLLLGLRIFLSMDGGGFEPPKQFAADLQSVPFGHSGIHPFLSSPSNLTLTR